MKDTGAGALTRKQELSYIFFAISLALILIIEISAYRNSKQLLDSSKWVTHTYAVMNQITKIAFIIADAQASRRGYAVTNDESFLGPYHYELDNLNSEFGLLREMVKDNPDQRKYCDALEPLLDAEMQRLRESVEIQRKGQMTPQAQLQFMEKGKNLRDSAQKVFDNMRRKEISLLESRQAQVVKESRQTTLGMFLGTLFSFALIIFGFIVLKREILRRLNTEGQLQTSGQRFRALATHLQFVREQERAKIAREIHDELGQVLTALKIDLSLLNNKMLDSSSIISRQDLSSEIEGMGKMIDRAIQSVRRIVTDLRPEILDHLGLQAAIDWHAQQFTQRTKIPVDVKFNLEGIEFLNSEKSTAIFRIFQETLTNVARHANATKVNVEFDEQHNTVTLRVKDNGKGISNHDLSKTSSFGILGLKERVLFLDGEIDITGMPGGGTTISVTIPKTSLFS